jgi:cytoskeletal protein RodZ
MISQQSQKKSWRQSKWFYPLVALLVVLLALGVLEATNVTHFVHHTTSSKPTSNVRPSNSVDYSKATANDNAANDARKNSTNPAETLDNGPNAIGSAGPLGVIIVNARRSGTDVRVGNIINGTTSGTCTLSATQSGQPSPESVSAQVQQDVNTYDCGVMHITLPDTGTWQLKLTIVSGSNSASATTTVGAS